MPIPLLCTSMYLPWTSTTDACQFMTCGWGCVSGGDKWAPRYPGCDEGRCWQVFKARALAAARMVKARVEEAEKHGTQLIVYSHYPGVYLRGRVSCPHGAAPHPIALPPPTNRSGVCVCACARVCDRSLTASIYGSC